MRTVMKSVRRSTRRVVAMSMIGAITMSLSACDSDSTMYGDQPSIGRDADGDLILIGIPCSGLALDAISIVSVSEDGSEEPVLRIGLDPAMDARDVVVPLDPLDLDRPGFEVEVFDEAGFAEALEATGDEYQILIESSDGIDGSNVRSLESFRPGDLPNGAAFDGDDLLEDAGRYSCPRGSSTPWSDAFDQ